MHDYVVMKGWRVGRQAEDTTRSGLVVPVGTEREHDALALIDVSTGRRFWAVPSEAWRLLWPDSGDVVVAVREEQVIAEEETPAETGDDGQYL